MALSPTKYLQQEHLTLNSYILNKQKDFLTHSKHSISNNMQYLQDLGFKGSNGQNHSL